MTLPGPNRESVCVSVDRFPDRSRQRITVIARTNETLTLLNRCMVLSQEDEIKQSNLNGHVKLNMGIIPAAYLGIRRQVEIVSHASRASTCSNSYQPR